VALGASLSCHAKPLRWVIPEAAKKVSGQMLDIVERKSRLVTLVYRVLGTVELPPLDALEGEVLVLLASAFHRQALVTMEAKGTRGESKQGGQSTSTFFP
jgi:hypothetical protein